MIQPQPGAALGARTTLQVGGEARWGVTLTDPEQIPEALAWAQDRDLPALVLGGGSNLLVADEGFPGLVIDLGFARTHAEADGDELLIRAEAGVSWDDLVAWTVDQGYAGLECLSGIPGQVGAAPIQNIGAYGQAVEDTLHAVEAWDAEAQRLVTLDRAACGFGYRHSRFKADLIAHGPGRWVITAVTFRLRPGAPATVRYPELARRLAQEAPAGQAPDLAAARRAVLALRRGKSMLLDPADPDSRSAGSFFTNPVVPAQAVERVARRSGEAPPQWPAPGGVKLSAAWLIERAGLRKGLRRGAVGLSSKHTLALTAAPGATALEVARFAAGVRGRILDTFGVRLSPEPNFIGFHTHGDALLDEITPIPL